MPRTVKIHDEALMERLMSLFWVKGYNATTVDDLCENTGFSKSYIYTNFGKKGIFEEAFYFYMDNYTDPFLQSLIDDDRGIEAIREKLYGLAESLVNETMPKACLFVNTVVEMGNKEKDFTSLNEMYCGRVAGMYADKVRYCIELGEANRSVPVSFSTNVLMNILFSLSVLYKTYSLEELQSFIDAQLALISA